MFTTPCVSCIIRGVFTKSTDSGEFNQGNIMAEQNGREGILVVDFGSQYVQLIARRVRENRVRSVVEPPAISVERIKEIDPRGIILSGGPSSVYDKDAPGLDRRILDLGIPVLGICYGMQVIGKLAGGRIRKSGRREYGRTIVRFRRGDPLFKGIAPESVTWMSHRDKVETLPEGFRSIARETPQR